jgi:hypothetical protein
MDFPAFLAGVAFLVRRLRLEAGEAPEDICTPAEPFLATGAHGAHQAGPGGRGGGGGHGESEGDVSFEVEFAAGERSDDDDRW